MRPGRARVLGAGRGERPGNREDAPARLLCTVAPAGLERFFAEFGDPVPTRTSPAPELSDVERRHRLERAAAKAPEYGIEMLAPARG